MIYHKYFRLKNGKYKQVRLYSTWINIRQRCTNKNIPDYKYWGLRGISVCKEWDDFEVFREWAIKNGYRKGLTIDRIDNDGNYESSNCQWATQLEQQAGKRLRRDAKLTYNDAQKIKKDPRTLLEIASEYGICFQMVSRIKLGIAWTEDRYIGKVQ